jgi:hypothetical protein
MARRVFAAGSVNLGPIVYQNDAKLVKDMAQRFTETGIKPQVECFDTNMISNANLLVKQGLLKRPLDFGFVMGAPGAQAPRPPLPPPPVTRLPSSAHRQHRRRYLLPPARPLATGPLRLQRHAAAASRAAQECSLRQLGHLIAMMEPGDTWTSIGIGKFEMPLAYMAIAMGGHVRVGLEDNNKTPDGKIATNYDLVKHVVDVAKAMGREIATPAEARSPSPPPPTRQPSAVDLPSRSYPPEGSRDPLDARGERQLDLRQARPLGAARVARLQHVALQGPRAHPGHPRDAAHGDAPRLPRRPRPVGLRQPVHRPADARGGVRNGVGKGREAQHAAAPIKSGTPRRG